ncbi:50S ribosome-binding GTPase, partial [bacterium]|nr:50S ribosome-binding GTPase [bacterium]
TDIAGTTRDVLEETLNLDGIPLTISDTAGIRSDENIDKVEAIGIDCSKNYIEEANIVLFLYDLTQGFKDEDKTIFELIKDKNYIKIGTKSDLTDKRDTDSICLSAVSGENIEVLKEKIKDIVLGDNNLETEFITNERQQKCLENAKKSLLQALETTISRDLQDLISIDLKSALMSVGEISGEVITDDILNNIFENFCIGK